MADHKIVSGGLKALTLDPVTVGVGLALRFHHRLDGLAAKAKALLLDADKAKEKKDKRLKALAKSVVDTMFDSDSTAQKEAARVVCNVLDIAHPELTPKQ
jgi:hypothetical protein